MRILLTGATSFTGYWIAKALSDAGHHVTATLLRSAGSYTEGARAERARRLATFADVHDECAFGSDAFLALVRHQRHDALCHHAAQVGDYRSSDYDLLGAVEANTRNARQVLDQGQFSALILTGSVFEPGEGCGEPPLRGFSAYGLSKSLSAQIFEHHALEIGARFGKFVIPNPFGPLEEPRFCAYLMRTWKSGAVAAVRTPDYIRDNIHVDLLARAYASFTADVANGGTAARMNPSGYVERQGDFAERFAREMRRRLALDCALSHDKQVDFSEPVMRVNTDPAWRLFPDWNEEAAWDAVAESYR